MSRHQNGNMRQASHRDSQIQMAAIQNSAASATQRREFVPRAGLLAA
jgi:hypothetical protein